MLLGSALLARPPPCQIECQATSAQKVHHLGTMCGGGGDEGSGKGAGVDDSTSRRIVASIEHGGRRCPTAAMGTHSQQKKIQQSTNILFDRY